MDFSNIRFIEIERDCCGRIVKEVLLYNTEHISNEDALQAITTGKTCDDVLCIPKAKWQHIFGTEEPQDGFTDESGIAYPKRAADA